jgi:hypothetical protein
MRCPYGHRLPSPGTACPICQSPAQHGSVPLFQGTQLPAKQKQANQVPAPSPVRQGWIVTSPPLSHPSAGGIDGPVKTLVGIGFALLVIFGLLRAAAGHPMVLLLFFVAAHFIRKWFGLRLLDLAILRSLFPGRQSSTDAWMTSFRVQRGNESNAVLFRSRRQTFVQLGDSVRFIGPARRPLAIGVDKGHWTLRTGLIAGPVGIAFAGLAIATFF